MCQKNKNSTKNALQLNAIEVSHCCCTMLNIIFPSSCDQSLEIKIGLKLWWASQLTMNPLSLHNTNYYNNASSVEIKDPTDDGKARRY